MAPIPSSSLSESSGREFPLIPSAGVVFPETEKSFQELEGHLAKLHAALARKPIPNLVKSYDLGPPIEYDADYSWHSLRKERQCPLPRGGCIGLINPNTELNYVLGFQEEGREVRFDPPADTILHGVDFLVERCDLGNGLSATVTFLPYDSATLFSFIELANTTGAGERRIRVHQLAEKEVFQYRRRPIDRHGRVIGPDSKRMAAVWVGTRRMKRASEKGHGIALAFAEWEMGSIGEAGELLAFMGAAEAAAETWTETPPNAKPEPPPEALFEPSVFHRAVRVYGVTVPAGGTARLAGFLALRRHSSQTLIGPRGARPYLGADEATALADCRRRVRAGLEMDWRKALGDRMRAYAEYPTVSLPNEAWESAFLACLELPRAETLSPFGTMPLPYYNFCRAYGNEPRQWWSYGEHGHESLSTFTTCLSDPDLAETHLWGHFINQDPEGGFPDGVNQQSRPGIRSFAASAVTCPFIAWEAWNAYLWGGDEGFLREAFAACSRSHAWWLRTRDRTGEGLCCWLDFGETVRDDGTVPTWRYEGAPVFFQEALDLNCYLLTMERTLADMAGELGDAEKAEEYRAAWRRRARTMNALMWDATDECYYGLSEISDTRVRVKDISTLMPLWCGLAPPERAEGLLALYRDPRHFATQWPVPVLAASDRTYLPDGHWHGGNWVEMSWLVALGLKGYGYHREAARLVERNVTMVFEELERTGHLREYFDSETGRGLSLFDYIWTSLPAAMIVEVFLGIRPTAEGLEIFPSLPPGWPEVSIENLHVRGKPLQVGVRRSASGEAAAVTVNGGARPAAEGRGVRIGWDEWSSMPAAGVRVEVVQPPQIPEQPAPPVALPEDVLDPFIAPARIRPTSEELAFRSRFLHYAVDPVPYIPPPTRKQ